MLTEVQPLVLDSVPSEITLFGSEVRSVVFEVPFDRPTPSSLQKSLQDSISSWLRDSLQVSLPEGFWDKGLASARLASSNSAVTVEASVQMNSNTGAFEFMIVNEFFRGRELTRVRALTRSTRRSAQIEISSYMESFDATRPVMEIPRFGDELARGLAEQLEGQIFAAGEQISANPFVVESLTSNQTPLSRVKQPGGLPVIVMVDHPQARAVGEDFARHFFGLAHTVLVEQGLWPKGRSNTDIAIHLREGEVVPIWLASQRVRRIEAAILQRFFRQDQFHMAWRDAIVASPTSLESKQTSLKPADSSSLVLEKSRLEEEVDDLKRRNSRLQSLHDDAVAEWGKAEDERESLAAELRRLELKLAALNFHSTKSSAKRPAIDLTAPDSELDRTLRKIEEYYEFAIVFTPAVIRSWRKAQKNGFTGTRNMETQLSSLCELAKQFRDSDATLGENLKDFAYKHFSLDLEMLDGFVKQIPFEFEGKTYSQEPHIRADGSEEGWSNVGRVYFAIDSKNRRFIVNHVGSKLQKDNHKS